MSAALVRQGVRVGKEASASSSELIEAVLVRPHLLRWPVHRRRRAARERSEIAELVARLAPWSFTQVRVYCVCECHH
jgi:hypothetical protein